MYCPICDCEVETIVQTVSETYPVKGEDISIDAHVRFCAHCHEDLWDEKLDAQNLLDAYALFRKKHGLLQPQEIRTIREKYGLSQTAFARILGLGDKTITRYENGSIADAAPNNLIYLCRQPEIFLDLLEKNRERISPQDYESAQARITTPQLSMTYSKDNASYSYRSNNVIVFTPVFGGKRNYG